MILKQVIKYDNAVAIEATWVDENDVAVKCQAYSNAQMAELAADIGADAAKYKYLMDEIAVTYVAPAKPTLEQVQAERWGQVKAKRDELEASGFMYAGHPMDSDPRAVQRINTAVQAAQAAVGAGQPFKIDWTCMDGHVLPLDATGMIGMPVYLALHANALHLHARALKTAITEATSVKDVEAIDVETGWPAL